MKHIYLVAAFSIFFINNLRSQDYHLFSFGSETIFELKNSNTIDCNFTDCYLNPSIFNTQISNQDTIYTFDKVYKGLMNFVNQFGDTCMTFDDYSLFGQQLTINSDFTFEFINQDGEPIYIRPNKNLNETWIVFQYQNGDYIEAEVIDVKSASILGGTDLIKTISFISKDNMGNVISSPINQTTLKVSKQFGLVKSPNFLAFPTDTSSLELVSHSALNTTFRNIKWKGIFDFSVGDIHQIHDYITGVPYYSDTYEKRVILTKDSTSSSWIYTIDRESYTENYLGDSIYIRDTITETYPFYHYSDTVGLRQMYFCYNGFTPCTPVHWTINNSNGYQKIMKTNWASFNDMFRMSDTCIGFTLGNSIPDTFYLDGLGGGYYHAAGSGSYHGRVLTYYKQGNTTWGNPVDFGQYNNISDQLTETLFLEVFPNPTSDKIQIETSEMIQNGQITIFDVTGKIVFEEHLNYLSRNSFHKIEVSSFANGLYIIQLSMDKKIWQRKFVKK